MPRSATQYDASETYPGPTRLVQQASGHSGRVYAAAANLELPLVASCDNDGCNTACTAAHAHAVPGLVLLWTVHARPPPV